MKKSKPVVSDTCVCGKRKSEAASYVFRSHNDRYEFHRCDCGAEWTSHLLGVDPAQPVSGDEVIEVHAQLERFEGRLTDLIAPAG